MNTNQENVLFSDNRPYAVLNFANQEEYDDFLLTNMPTQVLEEHIAFFKAKSEELQDDLEKSRKDEVHYQKESKMLLKRLEGVQKIQRILGSDRMLSLPEVTAILEKKVNEADSLDQQIEYLQEDKTALDAIYCRKFNELNDVLLELKRVKACNEELERELNLK